MTRSTSVRKWEPNEHKRHGLRLTFVSRASRLTGALELDPGHWNLLDESDQPGQDDIHSVPVQPPSFTLQAVPADMSSLDAVLSKGLDGIDELSRGLVVRERVEEGFDLFPELVSVRLPGGVVLDQGLAVVVQRRSLAVGSLRGDVCRAK
jgi:hypothetical protein